MGRILELALSGLPLWWDTGNLELLFGPEKKVLVPAVRRLAEMQDVLYQDGELAAGGGLETGGGSGAGGEPGAYGSPETGRKAVQEEGTGAAERALYFMYRALSLPEHEMLFEKNGIRYDITVLMPGSIEAECIKTVGHYHPVKPGAACTYPEVYEVLHGQARYLLQRPCCLEEPQEGLEQVIVVSAAAGDKVLIPPDFGHVTINPGPDFLVMSNLVATDFESVYSPLQEMGGAGYFGLAFPVEKKDDYGGSGIAGSEPVFKPNPCYASLPPLITARPQELPQFSLLKNFPQYSAFVENPAHFSFLTHPENYAADFQKYLQNIL